MGYRPKYNNKKDTYIPPVKIFSGVDPETHRSNAPDSAAG